MNNQHSDDRAQWVNANGAAENCVSEELNNAEQRHSQEMQQRFMGMTGVNTPEKMKLMQDWVAASQEAQQAAMANDTAARRRAQEKMNKLMGVDARADSAKARATCMCPRCRRGCGAPTRSPRSPTRWLFGHAMRKQRGTPPPLAGRDDAPAIRDGG